MMKLAIAGFTVLLIGGGVFGAGASLAVSQFTPPELSGGSDSMTLVGYTLFGAFSLISGFGVGVFVLLKMFFTHLMTQDKERTTRLGAIETQLAASIAQSRASIEITGEALKSLVKEVEMLFDDRLDTDESQTNMKMAALRTYSRIDELTRSASGTFQKEDVRRAREEALLHRSVG